MTNSPPNPPSSDKPLVFCAHCATPTNHTHPIHKEPMLKQHPNPELNAAITSMRELAERILPFGWGLAYTEDVGGDAHIIIMQTHKKSEADEMLKGTVLPEIIASGVYCGRTAEVTPDKIRVCVDEALRRIHTSASAEKQFAGLLADCGLPIGPDQIGKFTACHRDNDIFIRFMAGDVRISAQGFFLGKGLDRDINLIGTGLEFRFASGISEDIIPFVDIAARYVIDLRGDGETLGPWSPTKRVLVDNSNTKEAELNLRSTISGAFAYVHLDLANTAEEALALHKHMFSMGTLGKVAQMSIDDMRAAKRSAS